MTALVPLSRCEDDKCDAKHHISASILYILLQEFTTTMIIQIEAGIIERYFCAGLSWVTGVAETASHAGLADTPPALVFI